MLTVYSKNNCPQCDQAKSLLANKRIEFNEVRVDQVPEAREFLLTKGHRSVPQLYLNEQLVVSGGIDELKRFTESDFQNLKELVSAS